MVTVPSSASLTTAVAPRRRRVATASRYGATGGVVDALRRRSGRILLLCVLSSGNGLRGGARMAAEPQNTPSKALSSLGTDQEREPGTGPLARPVRVCQKAGAYTPLEPFVFRGSRRSRPGAPEP